MTMKLKGKVTKTEQVDVIVDERDVITAASKIMTISDLRNILNSRLVARFQDLDPTIGKSVYDSQEQTWEEYMFEDYHKGESVFKIIRPVNDAERLAFSMVEDVLRQL